MQTISGYQTELVALAVDAANRGPFGISRLRTSKHFTFEIEGDDALLSDELRAMVETELGEPLIEMVFAGFSGQVNLVPLSST